MVEATSYELACDFDRDGFICHGVGQSDPLNIIGNATGINCVASQTLSVVTRRTEVYDDSGLYIWNLFRPAGFNYTSRCWFGSADPTTGGEIPVQPSTQYTIRLLVKLISTNPTHPTEFIIAPKAPGVVPLPPYTSIHYGVVGQWAEVTHTFTTLSTTTSVYFEIGPNYTSPSELEMEFRGVMIVEGDTAPTAYNTGHVSNYLDDISAYLDGANWHWGTEQYTEVFAPPASMEVTLNNTGGDWSPENAASVYQSYISKGMLVRLRALVGSTYHQQFIGNLDSILVDAGEKGHRRAILRVVDPTVQLQNTEYKPLLLEDVTTDEALLSMYDNGVISYPYGNSHWMLDVPGASELGETTVLFDQTFTDFEVGDTTLAFAGDIANLDAKNTALTNAREIVYAEAGGRHFWNPQTGKLIFHRRTHDIRSSDAPIVLTAIELDEPPEYAWADDVINDVTVNYYPRTVGTAGSILYKLGNLPMTIAAGDTRQWSARYSDPDSVQTKIAGKDMITPVANTDYTINSQADGGGSDKTGSCTVTTQFLATEAIVTVVNGDASTVYVTLFRLRGTPLSMYAAASTNAIDVTSIGINGRSKRVLSLPALGDEATASVYANYTVQRFKNALGRIKAISLWANRDDDALENVLTFGVGSYIQYADAFLQNVSQNYIVTGLNHRLYPTRSHWVRLALEPLDRSQYWILDDAALSVLDSTTRLSIV